MEIKSKEHYDLMFSFEKTFGHHRLDHEDKSLWSKGNIYQSGETNELFKAYRMGYALAQAINRIS